MALTSYADYGNPGMQDPILPLQVRQESTEQAPPPGTEGDIRAGSCLIKGHTPMALTSYADNGDPGMRDPILPLQVFRRGSTKQAPPPGTEGDPGKEAVAQGYQEHHHHGPQGSAHGPDRQCQQPCGMPLKQDSISIFLPTSANIII